MSKTAAKQLVKRAARQAVAFRVAKRRFVLQIQAMMPTEESERRAQSLTKKARAAKQADFVNQFRA